MNLDRAQVVLRPRGLSEIMDLALRVYFEAVPRLFRRLSAFTLLPTFVLLMVLHFALAWDWGQIWLLTFALTMLLQGVFTVGVGRAMFEPDVGTGEVLRHFLRRLGPYLGALVLSRLLLAFGWIMAIVGVFWAWPKCFFVHEACLLEQASGRDATTRAYKMVNATNLGRYAGLGMLIVLAQLGFVVVAELLVNDGLLDFVSQVGKPFGTMLDDGGSPFAVAGYLVSIPYVCVVRFLAYVDTRTRRDGWDIQLRFMAVRNEAGRATGTAPGLEPPAASRGAA